jgi:hypothetical protein
MRVLRGPIQASEMTFGTKRPKKFDAFMAIRSEPEAEGLMPSCV